jgi:nucleotide-binding universal stress UspA family protein
MNAFQPVRPKPGAEPLPTLPSDGTMSQMPVVVGYNGKKHASEALDWAAEEALHRAAALIVLFAANYPGMTLPPGPGLFELEPGALDAATEVTDIGVAQVRAAYPDLIAIGRTVVTSPTEALVEESSEASLLVVGSRGRGSVLATLLSSISFAVASTAQCPVVVLKEGCAATVAGPRKRVVVGTDGSERAASAVAFAGDFAASRSASMEVICCTGELSVPVVSQEALRRTAADILERTCASLKETHPRLTVTTRLEDGVPELTLIDASTDAGLMVVGSSGRGHPRMMISGSTAFAVVHGAQCPVAVV